MLARIARSVLNGVDLFVIISSRLLAIRVLAVVCGISLGLLSLGATPAEASTSVLTPSPTSWDFGNVDIHAGGGGPSQTFTFTNNTAGSVNVSTDGLVGPDASEYQQGPDSCPGAVLSPGTSCSVQVTFQPTSVGAKSASLELTDDTGTVDVPLSGTGITGTLSAAPSVLDFQSQPY